MTNDQNIVRARHVESLAADLSDFVTQSNDELRQALQAELAEFDTGGNSAVILGSDSSIVDGTLWLEDVTNAAPVVKLYHGGNVYDFATTPDFTVIDHSAATVGQKFTVKSPVTSVVGSAYGDSITVNGSGNRIVETAGTNRVRVSLGSDNTIIGGTGNDTISLMGSAASLNHIDLTAGDNRVYVSLSSNNTIIGGTGNDYISLRDSASLNHIDLTAGGNNRVYLSSGPLNTIICGTGDDNIEIRANHNHIDLTAGNNTVLNPFSNNTIIGGTGDDSILINSSNSKIFLTGGNNTVRTSVKASDNTIIGGTGNDYISLRDSASLNHIDLTAGDNRVYVSLSSNTIIGGTGNDSIYLTDSASLNHIDLTAGNNTVRYYDNNTIIGGTGNDCFFSLYNNTSLNLFDLTAGGDNTVKLGYNSNLVTIVCGTGNDYIYLGNSTQVTLTAGNNTVSICGSNNTIIGGTGNDYIALSYDPNTIYYFADNDTLALPTVSSISWNASLDSSTVLITVNSSADCVIICQDYTATQFHISAGGTDGVYTIQGSSLVPAGS